MQLSIRRRPETPHSFPLRITRKRDEPIQPTVITAKTREAAGQAPASQQRAKLLLDESGQPFPVAQTSGLRAEALEVMADHLVHDALRRHPRLIGRRGLGHASVYGESRATCRTCHCQRAGWSRLEQKKPRNVLPHRRLSPVTTLPT